MGRESTTMSSDDDDDDDASVNVRAFLPTHAHDDDESILQARADDATLSARHVASDDDEEEAPPPRRLTRSKRVRVSGADADVRTHVENPEQAALYRTTEPPEALYEQYARPTPLATIDEHVTWMRAVRDARRALEDEPFYQQAVLVAGYAGITVDELVYVNRPKPPSRAPSFVGTYDQTSILNRLVGGSGGGGNVPPQPAPAQPVLVADVLDAMRQQQTKQQKALLKATRRLERVKKELEDYQAKYDEETKKTKKKNDILVLQRGKISELQDELENAKGEIDELKEGFEQIVVKLQAKIDRLNEERNIFEGGDEEASEERVGTIPPSPQSPLARKQRTKRTNAQFALSGDNAAYQAAVQTYLDDLALLLAPGAVLDVEQIERLRRREQVFLQMRRAQRNLSELEESRVTGDIRLAPTYTANQALAIDMVRLRFPQTLREATIDSFERSTTCRSLFALLTAALVQRGFFVSGRHGPTRASDYKRYEDGITYAMLQFRFAELQGPTVEMRYDRVAEFRDAAAARARPACHTSLKYGTTPYMAAPRSALSSAYALRSALLSSGAYAPLDARDAARSPYGQRGIAFGRR